MCSRVPTARKRETVTSMRAGIFDDASCDVVSVTDAGVGTAMYTKSNLYLNTSMCVFAGFVIPCYKNVTISMQMQMQPADVVVWQHSGSGIIVDVLINGLPHIYRYIETSTIMTEPECCQTTTSAGPVVVLLRCAWESVRRSIGG